MSDWENLTRRIEQLSQYKGKTNTPDPKRSEKINRRKARIYESKGGEVTASLSSAEEMIEPSVSLSEEISDLSDFPDIDFTENFDDTVSETLAEVIELSEMDDNDTWDKNLSIMERQSQVSRRTNQPDPERSEKIHQRRIRIDESKAKEITASPTADKEYIKQLEYNISAENSVLFDLSENSDRAVPATAKTEKVIEPDASDAADTVHFLDEIYPGNGRKIEEQEKKTEKKVRKKKAQSADVVLNDLALTLVEREDKVSAIMAELMKTKEYLALVNKQLYIYDSECGCFEKCDRVEGSMRIRSLIPSELQNKLSYSNYTDAYKLLCISGEIQKKDDFFSFNTPYTNCSNGVYDALHDTFLSKSPKYGFTNCLLSRYDPEAKHMKWDKYLDYITLGNPELKRLWRVVLGYIFSNYNNAKVGILVYGAPHTGKSVLCNLIERFFGSTKVSHVDISMFSKPEFTAHTAGKALNIVPDLKNDKLSDVGYLKSLLSHLDTISARSLYNNPQEIKSQTKMLFATNHLLSFDITKSSANDIEAVFNRLLYLPFVNAPVTKSQENKHLADELWEERDGILTWALRGGLQEYIDIGENFPAAARSEEIKDRNVRQYCPEMTFCTEYLAEEKGEWVSTLSIRDAYASYCMENGIVRKKKLDILTYIDEHLCVQKERGRVIDASGNKSNCWHYKNLKLLWTSEDEEDDGEDEEDYSED